MTVIVSRPATHGDGKSGWLLVGGILLATLSEAIASTALSLGRNDILGDTYATPDEFAWLDICYVALKLIGFALTPWLLMQVRPRSLLLCATLAMGAACAVAAATSRLDILILLRAIQGLGGAMILVAGQAILFWNYPRAIQPVLQGLFAMGSVVAPATIAPAFQGWVLDSQSWTWIFLSALPLSLAAGGFMMMSDPPPSSLREISKPRGDFDWLGFALVSAILFGATYLLSQGSRWDWFEEDRIFWISFAVSGALVLFVVQQRFADRKALFDLTVFATDDFAFAFMVSFVAGAALFGSAYLIPSFTVAVLRFTLTGAGHLLLPSGGLFLAALLIAALLIQVGQMPPIATVPFGILLIMTAMWMLSRSNGESGDADLMPAILLRGLGLGFLFLSITLIAFGRLRPSHIAHGIGIFSIGRQLGGLIGVAGTQMMIDHQSAANLTVLGASLSPGTPALTERLASTTSLLMARGLEAGAAARTATAILGRTVTGQATVIAFDTAFATISLLFIVAAPILIVIKIMLSRSARRRDSKPLDST